MAESTENISSAPKKGMSFLDHLEALRWHVVRSVIALLVITSILFFYSDFIFDTILFGPTKPGFITYRALCKLSDILHMGNSLCVQNKVPFKIVNTEIWGQLTMYMWGTLIAGFIVTMPYILWEVWRFVSPALKPKELKSTRGFVIAASFLFLLGVCFSYFIIVPWTVNFLGSFKLSSGTDVENLFNVRSYVSTVTTLVLWIGVIFELPMVTYILTSIGVVSSAFLKKYRKHSVVVVLIVAALIAPPDVASQVFISIPLYLLFEVSIFVAKYAEKRKLKGSLTANFTAENTEKNTQRAAEKMVENEITEIIIGCAIKVHKALGPGLLESAYEECLYFELTKANLEIEKQKAIPLIYEEVRMECGYRADFIINKKIIVEIKSVEALNDIHLAQILTYLKLTNCKVGLLINFNVLKLTDGVRRVVNKY